MLGLLVYSNVLAGGSDEVNCLSPTATYLDTTFVDGVEVNSKVSYGIARHLFLTSAEFGRMVTVPPFTPPSSLAVHLQHDEKVAASYGGNWNVPESKWDHFLTYTIADRVIGPGWQGESEIEVQRYDLKISYDLALAIKSAWGEMIRDRYRRYGCGRSGLDGTTFDFLVEGIGTGSVWSPRAGLAFEMVELGKHLIDITKSHNQISNEQEMALIQKLTLFENKCRQEL